MSSLFVESNFCEFGGNDSNIPRAGVELDPVRISDNGV